MQANLISVISEINKFIVSTNSRNNMATPFLADTIIKSCGPHKNTRVHYDRLVDGTHATLTTNQKWAKLISKAMTINRKKKSPTPTTSKNINTITSQRRPKTKPSPRQPVLKPAHRSAMPLKVTLQPPTTTTDSSDSDSDDVVKRPWRPNKADKGTGESGVATPHHMCMSLQILYILLEHWYGLGWIRGLEKF